MVDTVLNFPFFIDSVIENKTQNYKQLNVKQRKIAFRYIRNQDLMNCHSSDGRGGGKEGLSKKADQ